MRKKLCCKKFWPIDQFWLFFNLITFESLMESTLNFVCGRFLNFKKAENFRLYWLLVALPADNQGNWKIILIKPFDHFQLKHSIFKPTQRSFWRMLLIWLIHQVHTRDKQACEWLGPSLCALIVYVTIHSCGTKIQCIYWILHQTCFFLHRRYINSEDAQERIEDYLDEGEEVEKGMQVRGRHTCRWGGPCMRVRGAYMHSGEGETHMRVRGRHTCRWGGIHKCWWGSLTCGWGGRTCGWGGHYMQVRGTYTHVRGNP